MSPITDPSEEYFKDGLWGWDSVAGAWKKLYVVAGTNILNITVSGTVAVAQMTPSKLTPGICGWDGSAWHKLPMLFGYSDRWYDGGLTTLGADGSFDLYTTAVPAGYIYVLQVATMHNDSGVRGDAYIALKGNAHHHKVAFSTTPAKFAPTVVTGPIVLKQGDQLRFYQWSCINGDAIYSAAWGYKMRIAA